MQFEQLMQQFAVARGRGRKKNRVGDTREDLEMHGRTD
jgi:hypothetical protein